MPEEDRWSKKGWPFFRSGLGDIEAAFREMEEMMTKQFENLSKISPEDLAREQTLPDGTQVKSWGPFVYGYSVTMGPDGKAKVKEFGNLKPETNTGKPQLKTEEKREPLADVIPGDKEVRVIVELPGVEKEEIKLSGTADKLTISVDAPKHKYYKEVELPTRVDVKKATSKYKNGVLDITIPKKTEEETKSEPMKIE
ncbi:MAG: heat-shock protein Hsp20 [Candidatus Bathyarchaeum sp.]|nr:MAG: heat-shock protein Hsp20 [Candidatus Bathyarchaeum sp.]